MFLTIIHNDDERRIADLVNLGNIHDVEYDDLCKSSLVDDEFAVTGDGITCVDHAFNDEEHEHEKNADDNSQHWFCYALPKEIKGY